MLPSTIGYKNHDISRYRNPQYTMRARCGGGGKPFGPGPQYNIDRVTRTGKVSPPAYSIAARIKGLGKNLLLLTLLTNNYYVFFFLFVLNLSNFVRKDMSFGLLIQ